MSISAISAAGDLGQSIQNWLAKAQKVQSEFQKLGQDLQAGSLSQAQADFSVLSQNIANPLQSNSALAQAFSALGSALQSGNISAAQKAYSTLQQDWQQSGIGRHGHHSQATTNSSSSASTLPQVLSSLGNALQSGNLSAAQTAYATLQQALANGSNGYSLIPGVLSLVA